MQWRIGFIIFVVPENRKPERDCRRDSPFLSPMGIRKCYSLSSSSTAICFWISGKAESMGSVLSPRMWRST